MSSRTRSKNTGRTRDRGLTLPELLITMSILGIVVTVLSSAVIVSLRQQDNTEGRLNVARDEQSVGFVMPSDLASASDVTTAPQATPCGGATVCDGIDLSGGSNVLMLSWTTEDDGKITATNVSYHFEPSGDGSTYVLSRVECTSVDGGAWSCSSRIVMRDLPGPPAGGAFVPGVQNGEACAGDPDLCTRPSWVIQVKEPLAPDAIDEDDFATDEEKKDAQRVVVSINGGGDAPGAGGGFNQVNITAGGTIREEIDASSTAGTPAFVPARSRCGGPITLIVDDSGSVNTAMAQVRDGVRQFVKTLAGTPTQIQVVRFDETASALGGEWPSYYDMRDPVKAQELLDLITEDNLKSDRGTNWEDALYRTFYNPDGTLADEFPDTVVFFTDGVPTWSRLDHRGEGLPLPPSPPDPGPRWADANGGDYNQTAFNRANVIARDVESDLEKFIGVAVGKNIDGSGETESIWVRDPGGEVVRRYYAYERTETIYEARFQILEDGQWWTVDLDTYEHDTGTRRFMRSNGSWRTINPGYWSDHNHRSLGWFEVSQSDYEAADLTADDDRNDGLRFDPPGPVSASVYNANSGDSRYQAVTKTWIEDGPDYEVWTGEVIPGDPSFDSRGSSGRDAVSKLNKEIVAQLISATDDGIEGVPDPDTGRYTNVDIANMYVLPDWNQFPTTMEEIALGECGGTLTLSTRLSSGGAAPDKFKYVANQYWDSNDEPIVFDGDLEYVETTQQFVTGTFDLSIPDGTHLTIEIAVAEEGIDGYSPDGWSCRAGIETRNFELIDDPTSDWDLIRVRVAANEAVSCTQTVT